MDQSIISIDTYRRRKYAGKVDQQSQAAAAKSPATARSMAYAAAIANCEAAQCSELSMNELFMVLLHRMGARPMAIEDVNHTTLADVWYRCENEMERRAEGEQPETVPMVMDIPSKTPFATAHGDDDPEVDTEAYMVRHIHAEVLDIGTEFDGRE